MERPIGEGDIVMGLWEDDWYPAEVISVTPTGYRVKWFDGSRNGRLRPEDVRSISLEALPEHRFKIDDRILVSVEGYWFSGRIAGLFGHGYFVAWDSGEEQTRILEGEAFAIDGGEKPRLGDRVLCRYEEEPGIWYPALLKALFANEYEVLWEDGSGTRRVRYEDIVKTTKSGEGTNDGKVDAKGDSIIRELQTYLNRRCADGTITISTTESDEFCPNCLRHHSVRWIADKSHRIKAFLCMTGEHPAMAVVSEEQRSIEAKHVDSFLLDYPAVSVERSIWRKLFGGSRVDISAFPPFVQLSIGPSR